MARKTPGSYEEIEKKLAVEQTLLECIRDLYTKSGINAYNKFLETLGKYYAADRAYIFEFDDDTEIIHNTYEWCEQDIEPAIGLLANVAKVIITPWIELFETKGSFYFNSLDRDVDRNSEAYKLLKIQNIDSLMAVPLKYNDKILGFVGVDNVKSNSTSFYMLESIAALIVNEFQKRETFEQKILRNVSKTYVGMYVINIKTDEYKIINAVKNVKRHLSVEKRNKFARESMQNVIKNECAGKYVEKMLRFLDFDTIEERLKNYNTISLDFIGNVAGWCTATVLPSSYDSDGNLEEIIILIQRMDVVRANDVEMKKRVQEVLENQAHVYTEMLKLQRSGIIASLAEDNHVLIINQAAVEMFGWQSTEQFSGDIKDLYARVSDDKKIEKIRALQNIRFNGGEYETEFSVKHDDGSVCYILLRSRLITTEDGVEIVLNSLTDVTDSKKLHEKVIEMSHKDSLTQICNRGSGEEQIESLIKLRKAGMFCLFDVDKFKAINDTFGHVVGDEVLVAIANCMKNTFRDRDILMRLGGDEFAVYAVGIKDYDVGRECIERFMCAIEAINIPDMKGQKVSISLGAVIHHNDDETTFDEMYQNADLVMYKSKKTFGNKYEFYK